MPKHKAYLSLGANIGDRRRTIAEAIDILGNEAGEVVRQSSLVETAPWGFDSDNMFLNACLCIMTGLTPLALLSATQEIEKRLGRKGKSVSGEYHDRTIDIDILLYDDIHIELPELTIPHPLMLKREFVMKPLLEILDDKEKAALLGTAF